MHLPISNVLAGVGGLLSNIANYGSLGLPQPSATDLPEVYLGETFRCFADSARSAISQLSSFAVPVTFDEKVPAAMRTLEIFVRKYSEVNPQILSAVEAGSSQIELPTAPSNFRAISMLAQDVKGRENAFRLASSKLDDFTARHVNSIYQSLTTTSEGLSSVKVLERLRRNSELTCDQVFDSLITLSKLLQQSVRLTADYDSLTIRMKELYYPVKRATALMQLGNFLGVLLSPWNRLLDERDPITKLNRVKQRNEWYHTKDGLDLLKSELKRDMDTIDILFQESKDRRATLEIAYIKLGRFKGIKGCDTKSALYDNVDL